MRILKHAIQVDIYTLSHRSGDAIWASSLRGVLTFVASGLDINGCVLRGQHIYTVIQAVHSLLYIVAKHNLFGVVT